MWLPLNSWLKNPAISYHFNSTLHYRLFEFNWYRVHHLVYYYLWDCINRFSLINQNEQMSYWISGCYLLKEILNFSDFLAKVGLKYQFVKFERVANLPLCEKCFWAWNLFLYQVLLCCASAAQSMSWIEGKTHCFLHFQLQLDPDLFEIHSMRNRLSSFELTRAPWS